MDFKKIICVKRPKKLSSDFAKTKDVILHTLKFLNLRKIYPDLIYTLEPTSPLRSISTIKKSIKALTKNSIYDSLISVVKTYSIFGQIYKNKYCHHPYGY